MALFRNTSARDDFTVPHFELSFRKSSQRPKKVYPVDPGVISAFSLSAETTLASAFETTLFNHLRRKSEEVYYLETADHTEVDFVVLPVDSTPQLFQACFDITNQKTREREVRALISGMSELKVDKSYIITLDRHEQIDAPSGTIHCVPLWSFLLDRSL